MDYVALLARAEACERAGSPRDAEAAYDILIVAATREGDQALLAEACRRRAVLAHQSGDTGRARSALQQSYAVTTLMGDRHLTAKTLNTLGGVELETRNLDAAEAALTEAAVLASDNQPLLARISQNLGIVANIRGDHEAAAVNYRRSLAAYQALSDLHGSAIARHNLGMLAADCGDFAEALEHFEVCESLARDSNDPHLGALCRVNYAEVLLSLGRSNEARRAAEDAQHTFDALQSNFDAPDVQRVLALCDRAEGLLRQAESRLLRARELAQMADARLVEAEVARDLGRVYAESGRPKQARALFREAAKYFAELGADGETAATERELSSLETSSSGFPH